MGDRANIVVTDSHNHIVLYSHWAGTELPDILKCALKRGEGRWDDFQYLTRIIFCEMIKDNVMDTTGYGISQKIVDGEDRVLAVNVDRQTVTDYNNNMSSFEEYIEANLRDHTT